MAKYKCTKYAKAVMSARSLKIVSIALFLGLSFSAASQSPSNANTCATIYYLNGGLYDGLDARVAQVELRKAYAEVQGTRNQVKVIYDPDSRDDQGLQFRRDLIKEIENKMEELESTVTATAFQYLNQYLSPVRRGTAPTVVIPDSIEDTIEKFIQSKITQAPSSIAVDSIFSQYSNNFGSRKLILVAHGRGNFFVDSSPLFSETKIIGIAPPFSSDNDFTASDDRIIALARNMDMNISMGMPNSPENPNNDPRDTLGHSFVKGYFQMGLPSRGFIDNEIKDALRDKFVDAADLLGDIDGVCNIGAEIESSFRLLRFTGGFNLILEEVASTKNTLLHIAAVYSNNPDVINKIIDRGVPIDAYNYVVVEQELANAFEGTGTPLEAIFQADNSAFHSTAFHLAALHSNSTPVISALGTKSIEAGVDPNTLYDRYGQTPLHVAAFADRSADIIEALIAAGLDPNVKDNDNNNEGDRPLHLAAQGDSLEALAALIKAGADVNARDDRMGEVPLHTAGFFGASASIFTALIDADAEVNVCGVFESFTFTPLQAAVFGGSQGGVEVLLGKSANVNELCPLESGSGRYTALEWAVLSRDYPATLPPEGIQETINTLVTAGGVCYVYVDGRPFLNEGYQCDLAGPSQELIAQAINEISNGDDPGLNFIVPNPSSPD